MYYSIIRTGVVLIILMVLSWGCLNQSPGRFDHTPKNQTSIQLPKKEANISKDIIAASPEERHIWQKPEMVISKLGEIQGKVIADIGAGTGYFSFRFLPYAAKVIAVDVDPKMVRLMNSHKKSLPDSLRDKFEARLSKEDDPLLADNEADIVFMANVYPYIKEQSIPYLQHLKNSLKAGGKLMIVDFKKKHTPIGPPLRTRVALGDVEDDLIQSGFEILESDDRTLSYQYMIVAQRK